MVSYNSGHTLCACIGPLLAAPHVNVIVVDNASPENSLTAVSDLPVQGIQSGRNGGFGFGCNTGAAAGRAELVLFLNPDAVLAAQDLSHMVAVLDAEPDVALVGPRIVDGDGTLVPSVRRAQRASSIWAQALFLHRLFPHARWANEIDRRAATYEQPVDAEWVSGACMLVRRAALEQAGGFDEDFFLYCEDMDLCERLRRAGHRVRYEPAATARHLEGESGERTRLFGVLARSRVLYARKHASRLGAAAQRLGLFIEALTHVAMNAGRPLRARGYTAALRATVQPVRE